MFLMSSNNSWGVCDQQLDPDVHRPPVPAHLLHSPSPHHHRGLFCLLDQTQVSPFSPKQCQVLLPASISPWWSSTSPAPALAWSSPMLSVAGQKRDQMARVVLPTGEDNLKEMEKYAGWFFSMVPPKKLKYGKPRLGESTLTYIGLDTPNLA